MLVLLDRRHFVLLFFYFSWFLVFFFFKWSTTPRKYNYHFPKTGYCPHYSKFKPSKYWKYSILMAVPIRKSGFHKKWCFLFSLLSPDVLHYFWTKNHKNTSKCTLCPRLHPKSDFQFTKKEKHTWETQFRCHVWVQIVLFHDVWQLFSYRFAKDCSNQSYRNHVLSDFEMLPLGQKTLKISKNTLKYQHFGGFFWW